MHNRTVTIRQTTYLWTQLSTKYFASEVGYKRPGWFHEGKFRPTLETVKYCIRLHKQEVVNVITRVTVRPLILQIAVPQVTRPSLDPCTCYRAVLSLEFTGTVVLEAILSHPQPSGARHQKTHILKTENSTWVVRHLRPLDGHPEGV